MLFFCLSFSQVRPKAGHRRGDPDSQQTKMPCSRGAKPDGLVENSQTKLEDARAKLEEAREAQSLEADNRTHEAQTKLKEARAKLEEARAAQKQEADNMQTKPAPRPRRVMCDARVEEQRVKLEKARGMFKNRAEDGSNPRGAAQELDAKPNSPKLVVAEDRRAQRGLHIAWHASRSRRGEEDVPEPQNSPARVAEPNPPAVLCEQDLSTLEAVLNTPAGLAVEVRTDTLEMNVENKGAGGEQAGGDSPQSITTMTFRPAAATAKAQEGIETAVIRAFIDGERSMLERFESTLLKSSKQARLQHQEAQDVVVKVEERDEEQSMRKGVESFLTAVLDHFGFTTSSYRPYSGVEKRTRCGCY